MYCLSGRKAQDSGEEMQCRSQPTGAVLPTVWASVGVLETLYVALVWLLALGCCLGPCHPVTIVCIGRSVRSWVALCICFWQF